MAAKQPQETKQVEESQSTPESVLPWRLIVPTTIVLLGIALVVGFELVYMGRVLPGVTADGVYIGGLAQSEATVAVQKQVDLYDKKSLTLKYGGQTATVAVASLGVSYNAEQVTKAAMAFGRTGDWLGQMHAQFRSLFGKSTPLSSYSYNDAQLASALNPIVDAVSSPVSNASLGATGSDIMVTPASDGARLNIGVLTAQVNAQLAATSTTPVVVTTYALAPEVDTAGLEAAKTQATTYLAAPLTLTYGGRTATVPVATIASWLHVTSQPAAISIIPTYPLPPRVAVSLGQAPIAAYVSNLASNVDQQAENAVISMTNGQPTAASPGQNGLQLDQSGSVAAIVAALAKPAATDRTLALTVKTITPAVTSDSLASLGIKDLISEGETWFPGSSYNRNVNIRVGASRFNDILIAPGETFSFNNTLGLVDAAHGYLPGLVILSDHEEVQYGGGLCQVATTAYRAALLAGLPIVARTNHSYAVSWYTTPYGVPGVDATIYLPSPDLKFTNDTGSYILIQTIMSGSTLKFDFYGTKTKTGQIRGPYFVRGNNNPALPSQTVFYRDILDLGGQVTHTDTINTFYQSSTLFPITG
jgi:vancomycin resistance protein YoaR